MTPSRARKDGAQGRDAVRSSGTQLRSELDALTPETDDDAAPKLSGQAVLDSRWAFEQVIGVEAVTRALANVPPSMREAYGGATPLTWVPYSVMRAVHDAFAREAGRSVESLLEDVIPKAMERSFSTVWRLLLRFNGDAALIARTPLVYSRSRSRGTLTARIEAPGVGIAELTGWASIPARDVHALSISIATFLRLANRQDVAVKAERTAQGAVFRVTWRV